MHIPIVRMKTTNDGDTRDEGTGSSDDVEDELDSEDWISSSSRVSVPYTSIPPAFVISSSVESNGVLSWLCSCAALILCGWFVDRSRANRSRQVEQGTYPRSSLS